MIFDLLEVFENLDAIASVRCFGRLVDPQLIWRLSVKLVVGEVPILPIVFEVSRQGDKARVWDDFFETLANLIIIASQVDEQVRLLADLIHPSQVIVYLVRLDVLHDALVLDLGPYELDRLGLRGCPAVVRLDFLEGEPVTPFNYRLYQLMVVP